LLEDERVVGARHQEDLADPAPLEILERVKPGSEPDAEVFLGRGGHAVKVPHGPAIREP
jgi:hypothetical protein